MGKICTSHQNQTQWKDGSLKFYTPFIWKEYMLIEKWEACYGLEEQVYIYYLIFKNEIVLGFIFLVVPIWLSLYFETDIEFRKLENQSKHL